MAQIISGKTISTAVKAEIRTETEQLAMQGIVPGLAVVLVGADPASQVYVRNKEKACAELGFYSEKHLLPADITQAELLDKIRALNADDRIHGILVQLPLPDHLDARQVMEMIAPEKDVDGFHPMNSGGLIAGTHCFAPCTPAGVMELLYRSGFDPAGKHCVVLGRSAIVGKPMALLLLLADATVTVCHSKTSDVAAICRQADLIITSVGKAGFLTGDMVKPGATVIDVGINRDADGKLCGDADFASVSAVAGAVTPVPGGVGPMTIAMLMKNTLTAAKRK
jgi:methylenetetrahydrofolate dehydrogenase (NADP+)/methenyltetrahydrofolate cyclohydrolase